MTTSASRKVEAASESGRSDPKLPGMESGRSDRRRPLSHVRDRSVDSDQKTLFMFGNGGERSEAVDAKCSNVFGCVTMTLQNHQIEHREHRDNLRMNDCGRYDSLADLCRVFGMGMTARKKEREMKVNERKSPETSSCFSSSSSHACGHMHDDERITTRGGCTSSSRSKDNPW